MNKNSTKINLDKVKRDPYYYDLYESFGEEFIIEAGYFDDYVSDPIVFDNYNYPFPVQKVLNSNSNKIAVLVTTGSFCPVHDGHIEMLEKAKEAVEEKYNFDVVAGYIVPDHDDYIIEKNKDEAILAHERIRIINKKLKDRKNDWIFSSPIGSLFSKGSINFTEVLNYKEKFFENLNIDVEIIYVCGGDNSDFSKTFVKKGKCVIVNRPGYKYNKFLSSNILHVYHDNPMSSTEVRKTDKHTPTEETSLILRIEEDDDREPILINTLLKYFKNIRIEKLNTQKENYKHISFNNLVSLDSMFELDNNLHMSRHYDLFGQNFIGYGRRPGYKDLLSQASEIEKGNYILIDDDIHTGGTMRFAKSVMESTGHTIDGVMSITISNKGEEILDARDFLLGKKNSGLVMKVDNVDGIIRAPYIYPFVNVFERCSIIDPLKFSLEVWRINLDHFKYLDDKLSDFPDLKEMSKNIFEEDISMEEYCNYYIKLLEKLL